MTKDYFRELDQYNYWVHRQVWACVESLTDERFKQHLDYSIGAIYSQCVHTMAVESWWFHFLRTGKLAFVIREYPAEGWRTERVARTGENITLLK